MRAALLALVALAASAPFALAGGKDIDVDIVSYGFEDAELGGPITLALGEPVTWLNVEGSHTVVSIDLAFDSGRLYPGDTFTFTPTLPGVYQYACTFHSASMQGLLVVG